MANRKKSKRGDLKCFTISRFICEKCGNVLTIPRKTSNVKERGHLKKIYCPFCKDQKNMMEIRNCDYWKNGLGESVS